MNDLEVATITFNFFPREVVLLFWFGGVVLFVLAIFAIISLMRREIGGEIKHSIKLHVTMAAVMLFYLVQLIRWGMEIF